MCGIIGYTGKKQALPFLQRGLKKLEYRGYDSVGVAVQDIGVTIVKRQGRIEDLIPFTGGLVGFCGIGHTRWATHGKPSERNAHPHRAGKYALVHNGILENYRELKEELSRLGVSFESETDSEVIAALFSVYGEHGLLAAAKEVLPKLKGSYAIAVISEEEKGKIFVSANGSPLVVGKSEHGYFLSSDLPALACFAPFFAALSDGESALLCEGGVAFFNGSLDRTEKEFVRHGLLPQETEKKGFSSFMEKEIFEIPFAVQRTIDRMERIPLPFEESVRSADRLIFTACGTAYHSCLVAKWLAENILRIPCECVLASEFRYNRPVLTAKTVVFAVSQSGETADTLACAKMVKEMGGTLIGVTNVAESSLSRITEYSLVTVAGVEIGVAATKSYLSQLSCFYTLFYRLGNRGLFACKQIPFYENKALFSYEEELNRLAKRCQEAKSVFFIGRGLDYAVAVEAALKMKEITYRFAEGYAAGELKHGTLALIDETSVVIALVTQSPLAEKMENAVAQVSSRGAKVALLSDDDKYTSREFCEKYAIESALLLPKGEEFSPLVAIIPIQRLVLKVAQLLSLDPDKPRNLAKSVTVE